MNVLLQCRGAGLAGRASRRGEEAALEAVDEELLQRSAARIQAGVRGFLVRRRQRNAAVAAAKIQAGFRGYRTRRALGALGALAKQRPQRNGGAKPCAKPRSGSK